MVIEPPNKNAPVRRQSPTNRWHVKEANRCHAPEKYEFPSQFPIDEAPGFKFNLGCAFIRLF